MKDIKYHSITLIFACSFVSMFFGFMIAKYLKLTNFTFETTLEFEDTIQIGLSVASILTTIWLALHISNVIEKVNEQTKVEKQFYFNRIEYVESIVIDFINDISICEEDGSTISFYKVVGICKRLRLSINQLKEKLTKIEENAKFEKCAEKITNINDYLTNSPNSGNTTDYVSITDGEVQLPDSVISKTKKELSEINDILFELKFDINSKL